MSALLWLLPAVPAAAGTGLLLAGRRADRGAVALSLTVAAGVVVLTSVLAATRPSVMVPFMAGAGFGLGVDTLSALVLVTVSVVALLVLVFAAGEGTEAPARFHGLMLVFLAAVLLTTAATTLPALLFAWEVMGATSYALIGFSWRQESRVSAGLTAFVVTRTADLGMYLAAGVALAGGAGMVLTDLSQAAPGWRDAIAAGLVVAAAGKAAQLPFSFWLSRAMEGPSTVSALLHSAAMVAMGGYVLLRVEPLLQATGWAATATAWLGALTALALGMVALAQRDLKQLLAASTAAQLGFVVLGAGLGATAGGAAHLVAHASTKALLFLVAGAWLSALGTKQLAALRGAGRRWPVVGAAFAVGALALAGVAPLSLWATKDAVLAAALSASPALYIIALAAAALSAAYAGKALALVWRRPDGSGEATITGGAEAIHRHLEQQPTGHVGRWETLPVVILAVGAAGLGLLALPPVGAILRTALGDDTAAPHVWEMVLTAALALVVLALLMVRPRLPEPGFLGGWLGLERAADAVAVRPTLALARVLSRFDDQVLDRAVDSTARAGMVLAQAAAAADRGGVDRLVETVARGARHLGQWARIPQSGQVHQYYAQLTAVLLGVAVLFAVVR
ncbi:proton-conducting transporter membrane subunit [Georgenia sp. 10Sc9-8]|uniref:Proton-conducting transporter membrane subunit n=1 Tax=Georgenia halotolerans TaxID=3028317 RepID=A0ABT5U181_9MICO|nr:proton-conducting transporter membrane subunit [Georgenia halotolerans]